MTETVEKLEGSVSGEQEKVLEMQAQISELEHTVDGLSVTVQEQFAGGINYIKNSAGLNGITDDWTTTGTVATDSSTDVQNNTTSDSCFVLGDTSTLKQVITRSSNRHILRHFIKGEKDRCQLQLLFLCPVQRQ